jgi:hypothetical protein
VNEEQSPFTTNTVVALPADLLVALNPKQQALVQRFADRVVRATRAQSIQRILTLEKQCTELNDQLARMLTRTLPPPRPGVRG